MDAFISEDELKTYEGWLRYQAIDAATMTAEQLSTWRRIFDETRQTSAANPKVGLMKLRSGPGEHLYAVAVREGTNLWLTLWVRCSEKSGVFVMRPMGDRDRDIHTRYHRDGTQHMKSHKRKVLTPQQRQPLTGVFRGIEELGIEAGHSPKGVGAICEPADFSGVVEVASGVLGPKHGAVSVALLEPGHTPPDYTWGYEIVTQTIFREVTPNVVISVLRHKNLRV